MAEKSTKMRNRGKNINEILDPNKAPTEAKREALRRTLLAAKLNTSRCTTSQELEDRFNLLFQTAYENGFVPTVEMLGLCSGWDKRDILRLEHEEIHKGEGFSRVVKNAKNMIGSAEGLLALDGEINSTVYIFRAKNYQGMTDKQEVVLTPNTIPQSQMSAEEILNNLPQKDNNEPLQLDK